MKRLLTVLLLACGNSFAGEPDGAHALLSGFYDDFNGRRIERLAEAYFHPGAQAVFGEHVTILSGQEDVKAMFLAIFDGLDKRGYHHTVVRDVSMLRLGENYVVATVLIDRIAADGTKIDSACSSYSLVKAKQAWRFLSWIPTDPRPNGRCP